MPTIVSIFFSCRLKGKKEQKERERQEEIQVNLFIQKSFDQKTFRFLVHLLRFSIVWSEMSSSHINYLLVGILALFCSCTLQHALHYFCLSPSLPRSFFLFVSSADYGKFKSATSSNLIFYKMPKRLWSSLG